MRRPLVVPPRAVLLAYLNAHADFALGPSNIVRSVRALDPQHELGRIERTMVDVIRTSPTGILDRASILERASGLGVNANSVSVTLTYSPVIEHLGTDLWTVRGTLVDPVVIEAARRANSMRPKEHRVIDYGWTSEGELWIAARIPASFESYVFNVPSAVSRLVIGRDFVAVDADGNDCGRIRVYDYGAVTGFVPFLRRAGADEDDMLFLRFNLSAARTTLSLVGDDELDSIGSHGAQAH